MNIPTIRWVDHHIQLIDQRKLPNHFKIMRCRNVKSIWYAIKTLAVRGAPAIGVAAAFGILLGVKGHKGKNRKSFERIFSETCLYLSRSRPTAVNLFNAIDRMRAVVEKNPKASPAQLKKLLKKEAMAIFNEDRKANRAIGQHGAKLLKSGMRVLTVCNAGALATVDYGTALGVIYSAKKNRKKMKVFACETRPLLQGARLTAWELQKSGIDVTLICDNMAATLMYKRLVDCVITGADCIALNGDVANKIGTYNLAVLARYHRIPFYVVAPLSTFDAQTKTGKHIPIEQRAPGEVTHFKNVTIAPKGVKVFNPAFDVTPHNLITAIVTEKGIVAPSFKKNIRKILQNKTIHA